MNSQTELLSKIEALAAEVAQREGCRLYDIEMLGTQSGRTLRVTIDKEGTGVGVDDCANVSRGLNLLLDVDDLIPGGAYNLEVSSPGLDRQLRKPWHFQTAVGQKVWVKLRQPMQDFGIQNSAFMAAKQITQNLNAAQDEYIEIQVLNETVKIPYSAIEKAKIIFEFAEKGKKEKTRGQ